MKKLLYFLGFFIFLVDLSAQPISQVKIQLGTIRSFVSSHESHKYAYKMCSPYELYFSNFGIEFERFSSSGRSWFICGTYNGGDLLLTELAKKFKATTFGAEGPVPGYKDFFNNKNPQKLISDPTPGKHHTKANAVNGNWTMVPYSNNRVEAPITVRNVYFDTFGKIIYTK